MEKRGPALAAAFDADGKPTKAAAAWAASNGITAEQAERLETDKGAWLIHKALIKGESTASLLPAVISTALAKLPHCQANALGRFNGRIYPSCAHCYLVIR